MNEISLRVDLPESGMTIHIHGSDTSPLAVSMWAYPRPVESVRLSLDSLRKLHAALGRTISFLSQVEPGPVPLSA